MSLLVLLLLIHTHKWWWWWSVDHDEFFHCSVCSLSISIPILLAYFHLKVRFNWWFYYFPWSRFTHDPMHSPVPTWTSHDSGSSLTLVTTHSFHVLFWGSCTITSCPVWRSYFAFWRLYFFRNWLGLSSLGICTLLAGIIIGRFVCDCLWDSTWIGLSTVGDKGVFL